MTVTREQLLNYMRKLDDRYKVLSDEDLVREFCAVYWAHSVDSEVTQDEAIDELKALDPKDKEVAHYNADNLILHFLQQNGFGRLAEAYEKARDRIGFWYA